jgi:hypothetical protein
VHLIDHQNVKCSVRPLDLRERLTWN